MSMKKLLPILLTIFVFSGCTNGQINSQDNSSATDKYEAKLNSTLNISDIFPFSKNSKLNYTGSAGDSSNSYFYADYIKKDRLQFRMVNSGTSIAYVLEYKNGELRQITSRDNFFYHYDLTDYQNPNPEIILKEPLVKGTSWMLQNGKKRCISNDNVQVATPSGKYICIEITTETDTGKIVDYYAPNVGLVEKTTYMNKTKTITYLESTTENATSTDSVKFFYPDLKDKTSFYHVTQLHFKTDDDSKTLIEKYLKEVPSEKFTALLSKNTKINSINLNINTNTINLDLSKEFLTDTKLDKNSEKMVLQCITNTICDYYNMDKLIITIDGNPYKSSNITMKPNEILYIDIKNIQEYR